MSKNDPEITISRQEAEAWLAQIVREISSGDLDALMTLFAPDVRFRFSAFGEEFTGRDALKGLAGEQIFAHLQDLEVSFDVWGVKDNEIMAFWRGSYFWKPTNELAELDGVVNIAYSARENGRLLASRFVRWFDQDRS